MKAIVDVVMGLQYGDEGKGRIVDHILNENKYYTISARYCGGNNAGHSVWIDGKKYVTHSVPTGILHPKIKCVIGNGCVINPSKLVKEIEELKAEGFSFENRLFISDRAHVIFEDHIEMDIAESQAKIGTTAQGIGPCYADKHKRTGVRLGDLRKFCEENNSPGLIKYADYLAPFICDTVDYLHSLSYDDLVLAEGAQSHYLDIDLGDYPYVTSCNTTIGSVLTGLGVPYDCIRDAIGVLKPYVTKVGTGELKHEISGSPIGEEIVELGQEYGATTGRKRRIGWLDVDQIEKAIQINGIGRLMICKFDIFQKIKTRYVYKNNEELDLSGDNLEYLIEDFLNLFNLDCSLSLGKDRNNKFIGE